jgi:ABC-type nitrate/sulfonate/bicarbonate transport system substrate-binding protein
MTLDTLWYTRCPVPTASGIAFQLGWIDDEFADDGITVRSLASSPDREVRAAHYMLTQRDLIRHGGTAPVFLAADRGVDVRILAISWPDVSYPLLTRPDTGIESAADLRGRRLSLPRRVHDPVDFWQASALRVYDRALAAAGLTLDDVELVEIRNERQPLREARANVTQHGSLWGAEANAGLQREEALALVRGEVDAIASEAGIAANLCATLGLRTVVDVGRSPERLDRVNNDAPLTINADGPLVDRHPELVARWLARVLDAARWAADHEDGARRIVAAETGIPEDLVDVAYSPDVHRQLGIGLEEELIAGVETQAAHLLAHGKVQAPVDVRALVDPGPLEAALELVRANTSQFLSR